MLTFIFPDLSPRTGEADGRDGLGLGNVQYPGARLPHDHAGLELIQMCS
jgi:hypothetical protein